LEKAVGELHGEEFSVFGNGGTREEKIRTGSTSIGKNSLFAPFPQLARAVSSRGAQKTAFVFTDQLVAETLFGARVEAAQTQRFQIVRNPMLQATADIAPFLCFMR
jgi:hypothetical protein